MLNMLKLAFVSWLFENPNIFIYGMLGVFGLCVFAGLMNMLCKGYKNHKKYL